MNHLEILSRGGRKISFFSETFIGKIRLNFVYKRKILFAVLFLKCFEFFPERIQISFLHIYFGDIVYCIGKIYYFFSVTLVYNIEQCINTI